MYFRKQEVALATQLELLSKRQNELAKTYEYSLDRSAERLFLENEQQLANDGLRFASRQEGVAFIRELLDRDAKLAHEGKQRINTLKKAIEDAEQTPVEKPKKKKGIIRRIFG